MAVYFLPVFANNLPGIFLYLRSSYFQLPLWFVLAFLTFPNLFASKYLFPFYLFAFVFILGLGTFWEGRIIDEIGEVDLRWALIDIHGAFLAVLMLFVFLKLQDYRGLAIVSICSLVFILFTSITTIIGVSLFPGAVRQMIAVDGGGEMSEIYQRLGIAGYGFFAGIIFLFPILGYLIKNQAKKSVSFVFYIIVVFTLLYALFMTEFTTAFMLAVIFFLFSFIVQKYFNRTIIAFSLIFIVSFFVFNEAIADFFYYLSVVNPVGETISARFKDVGDIFFFGMLTPAADHTYFTSVRLFLSEKSLNMFLENPLIGAGWGGGHASWFDRLGMFGLLGFTPWILIFYQQVKFNLSKFDKTYRNYYLTSVISCIFLGLITTMANSIHAMLILFFVIPGLYFLPTLKKEKRINKQYPISD